MKPQLVVFAAAQSAATACVADDIRLGTGVDCSSGRYGGREAVGGCMLPFSLQALGSHYELKLSVPYFSVDAGQRTSGYGDASFYAARTVAENLLGIDAIEIGARYKARNGSVERGLGSGRTSWQLGFGLTEFVQSRHLLLFYAGITSGQRSDGQRGAYATAWYKYLAGPGTRLGAIYENTEIGWSRRSETLTLMPEFVLSRHWTIKPFAYVGLHRLSPERGAGIVSTYALQ